MGGGGRPGIHNYFCEQALVSENVCQWLNTKLFLGPTKSHDWLISVILQFETNEWTLPTLCHNMPPQ